MGDFGSCICNLLFLASLSFLPGSIHLVCCYRDRNRDSTDCDLVVRKRNAADCRGYSCLSATADPAGRLPLAVISIDLRTKFNAGKGHAELLSKPAHLTDSLSQFIIDSRGSVASGCVTEFECTRGTNGRAGSGFSRTSAGLHTIRRASYLYNDSNPGINCL